MKIRSGDEVRVGLEIDGNVSESTTQSVAPQVGHRGFERHGSHDSQTAAVRELPPEDFEVSLRKRLETVFDLLDPRFGAKPERHIGEQPSGEFRAEIESDALRLLERSLALRRECPARALEHSPSLALGLLAEGLRHLPCLARGTLERCGTLVGDAGSLGFDGLEVSFGLGLDGSRLVVSAVDLGPAGIDHPHHRPIEKTLEEPNQDGEVEGLQPYGPPIDVHDQPAKGLAKSSRRATTRQ